jgi:hypothetical protein
VPFIGKSTLSQVDSEMIQQYINKKLECGRLDGTGGLSIKTARDIIDLLKRSLRAAGLSWISSYRNAVLRNCAYDT